MTSFYGIDKNIIKPEKYNLPEESLNLLLRRADWRFLMLNPSPKKTICFAEGELTEAIKLISDCTIDNKPGYSEQDCDLAVLVNPEMEDIRAALSALKNGGCCYIEWTVNPLFRPNSIRTKLESAGFEQIKFYLPKPPPIHSITSAWIPLQDSRVIYFFIKDSLRKNPKRGLNRVGSIIRNTAWFLGSKLFASYPWFLGLGVKEPMISSLAYKSRTNATIKPISNQRSMLLETAAYPLESEYHQINSLEAKLKNLGICDSSKKISTLMITSGTSIYNKPVLLIFPSREMKPSIVVKRSRIAESAFHLTNEAKVLTTLQENNTGIEGIPNLLFSSQDSGCSSVGESFIDGVPIANIVQKKNYLELAMKATNFQITLAERTRTQAPENWWDILVKPVISYFTSTFESVLDPKLIQKSKDILSYLELTHIFCEHRDFSPWNILINSYRELGVIDWEGSTLQGLPAVDLINCLTYLSFYLDNNWEPSKFSECYRRMLDENSFVGTVFKECLTYYCNNIGLPFSMIPSLRLFAWINALNWEYYALGNYSDSPTNPEAVRNLIHFGIWKEEVLHTEKT